MYADDLCIFSPSVAGLRKLTDCCAKYGELFNITYNAKKSFCMVIDNQSQDRKHFHCIHLDNHPLPYTTKCKYLGHIINNNLTDDDDMMPLCPSQCISSKILVIFLPKLFYFKHTVLLCILLVFGAHSKNIDITVAYNNSLSLTPKM